LILTVMGESDTVSQFWVLSYPEGTWSRLTNDLSNYASFGVSADRRTLAAGRWDYQLGIAVMEGSSTEPAPLVAATPFIGAYLGWLNDTLLYATLSPANTVLRSGPCQTVARMQKNSSRTARPRRVRPTAGQ
jgi:hypothetical protein